MHHEMYHRIVKACTYTLTCPLFKADAIASISEGVSSTFDSVDMLVI